GIMKNLAKKTFLGFLLGIIIGVIFGEPATILQPIGDLFLKLISMIVVPLIFFSITSGVASIGDFTKLKKIGVTTLVYFVVTTALAGFIGIAIANFIKPGLGVVMDVTANSNIDLNQAQELPSL